tara:strand:- start:1947 stop:2555 length:609 start_codon:yes stop_codon:yes gene_type:complete
MNDRNKIISSSTKKDLSNNKSVNQNIRLDSISGRDTLREIKQIMEKNISDMKKLTENFEAIGEFPKFLENIEKLKQNKLKIKEEEENLKTLKEMSTKWMSDPEALDESLIKYINKDLNDQEYLAMSMGIEIIPIITRRYSELMSVQFVVAAHTSKALEMGDKTQEMIKAHRNTSGKTSHLKQYFLWSGWAVAAFLLAFIYLN